MGEHIRATKAASAIINHFNEQKLIILGVNDSSSVSDPCLLSTRICRLLSATWKASDGTITPSEASQKHLCERVRQGYPNSKALESLQEVELMGF